jgi:hypothetical protein
MQTLKIFGIAFLFASVLAVCAAQDGVTAVEGTVKKVDTSTKTVVVETADGTDHAFHYVGKTTVRGAEATGHGTEQGVDKLGEGTKVVVHYTSTGGKDTAKEVDRVGDDGMKATKGTVEEIDRGGKKLVVKTADGTKDTFRLSDDAAVDAGKDIGKGSVKTAHVTVYYTESAGKKVAHFFKPD